jgi:hypothetical protein
LFHDDIFIEKKNENFTPLLKHGLGFGSYAKKNNKNPTYLLGLLRYIEDLFKNLELIKGNRGLYNEKYMNVYIKYHFFLIYSKMVDYVTGLMNDQTDIVDDANEIFRSLEEVTDDDLDNSIRICSTFIIDSLSHLFMKHFDPLWLFVNHDKNNLLAKQKEREKQNIIKKLDGSSQEERYMIGEKNKIGTSNFWKDSNAEAAEYIKSNGYAEANEAERIEILKEIYANAGLNNDANEEEYPVLPQFNEEDEEIGYRDDIDIEDENYEEYVGGLDEEQEPVFNE